MTWNQSLTDHYTNDSGVRKVWDGSYVKVVKCRETHRPLSFRAATIATAEAEKARLLRAGLRIRDRERIPVYRLKASQATRV